MKTFNLAIATLAIAAAVSSSAFASSFDANGNIPNHEGNGVAAFNDAVATQAADQMVKPAALSANDALLLQLEAQKDYHNRH